MTHTTITLESVMSDSDENLRIRYAESDTSGKAKIRTFVAKAQNVRLAADDLEGAKRWMSLLESIKSSSSTKPEVSAKDRYAEFVATVLTFASQVESGEFVPDWIGDLDESDKTDVLDNAGESGDLANSDMLRKLRNVRGTVKSDRSVTKHLEQVFSDLPAGTVLTFAKAAGRTSEEYGTDHPSSGAVAAVSADRAREIGLERIEADTTKGIRGGLRKIA